MNYRILGDADCPIAEIYLNQGETVKIERGAMAYMSGVQLSGKLNSKDKGLGGVFGAIGRSITSGESMFITIAEGMEPNAVLGIAPSIPGRIAKLEVGAAQYRLNTSVFLAADENVTYVMKDQNIGKAFLGGTGGIFVMETSGCGDLLVNAFGDLIELNVTPERPIIIDNEHVVAWDRSLDYHIEFASGTFGFKTGEGLVNRFFGSGKVLIQTRNIHSLANAVQPFLPSKN